MNQPFIELEPRFLRIWRPGLRLQPPRLFFLRLTNPDRVKEPPEAVAWRPRLVECDLP